MKNVARGCALALLNASDRKKKWTPEERRHWTTAFNALQRLAGKKIIMRGGKLTKEKAA